MQSSNRKTRSPSYRTHETNARAKKTGELQESMVDVLEKLKIALKAKEVDLILLPIQDKTVQ